MQFMIKHKKRLILLQAWTMEESMILKCIKILIFTFISEKHRVCYYIIIDAYYSAQRQGFSTNGAHLYTVVKILTWITSVMQGL